MYVQGALKHALGKLTHEQRRADAGLDLECEPLAHIRNREVQCHAANHGVVSRVCRALIHSETSVLESSVREPSMLAVFVSYCCDRSTPSIIRRSLATVIARDHDAAVSTISGDCRFPVQLQSHPE